MRHRTAIRSITLRSSNSTGESAAGGRRTCRVIFRIRPPRPPGGPSGLRFNTLAVTVALAGRWAPAGGGTSPGPAVFSLDGSIGRGFRFGERRSGDVQFQAQNILNKVTIRNWGTTFGSVNY